MLSYAGYRVLPEGLSVWPGHRIRYRWSQLAKVSTSLRADRRGWETNMVFTVGGHLKVGGARLFTWGNGLGRYAELLGTVCTQAPERVEIDETTREVARWGTRAVRRKVRAQQEALMDAAGLLARARNQRAWLEHKQALRTIEQLLAGNPNMGEAHELNLTLLGETGARPKVLLAAADRWIEACPGDRRAREMRGLAGLQADDRNIAAEVAQMLAIEPDQLNLVAALSAFHFRHGDLAAAQLLWERYAVVATDDVLRRNAERNIDYLRRYAANPAFRTREKLKRYGMVALAWMPVVLILAIYGGKAWLAWHPPVERPNPQVEKRQEELRESLARSERWLQENTGLVSGTDEQLRERASRGEAAAQYTLAFRLLQHSEIPGHVHEGLQMLEAAATQDYRWALLDLGERLDEGSLVAKDPARALRLFEKAAELGSPRAARLAGEHYRNGNGVSADPAKAFAYFEQSAKGGNPQGMAWAGFLLERGEGVTRDLARALDFYQQAAKRKNEWATERLMSLLVAEPSLRTARSELVQTIWQFAEGGASQDQIYAAQLVLNGFDVEPNHVGRVLHWLEVLAEKGDGRAAFLRGYFPWTASGEPFDILVAIRWFLMAADKDYPPALSIVSRCYAYGLGVTRDLKQAQVLQRRLKALPGTESLAAELDRAVAAASRPLPASSPAGETPFSPIYRARPEYPMRWRLAGVEGEASLTFRVNAQGFLHDIQISEATKPEFGAAAYVAVACWRLMPKIESSGTVSNQRQQIPVVFTLNSETAGTPTEAQ